MLGITEYIWRLVPANPILQRVVQAGGKRRRDLLIRAAYLGLLVLVVIFSLLSSSGSVTSMGLAELAGTSAGLFQRMSYLQLALVALLAPVFTAGAITQEKDSQTYDILLSTPLTNGQIVLGSLLSRLFFVVALLISGIPIFSITQVFGGVAVGSIVQSFLIAAATAFVTGALAMAIATFKVGTRRTIFSFYLLIVIYLMGIFLLDKLAFFHITLPQTGKVTGTSWLTGIHPFLALRVIFNDPDYLPPDLGSLPDHLKSWPWGWYLSSPHTFYISSMFLLSMGLIVPSIILLRRVAQSTINFRTWILTKLHLSKGDRTRKPRMVWQNPIAWREAKTKASAARATFLRYGFMGAGVAGALGLVTAYSSTIQPARYVLPSSYNPVLRQLTIVDKGVPETMQLSRMAAVTLNGNATPIELALKRKLEVKNYSKPAREIISIDLTEIPRSLEAAPARSLLLGFVMVEFAVILLIVTNAAASTVTREKEDGSLDLLLTTPITSRYYIWGKLRGLVSFVLPLIAVPVASAAFFIGYDMLRLLGGAGPDFKWIVFPEAILIMPPTLIIVAAFAAILGMQMSLRCRKTVVAVMSSVGIVVGICATLGWCGFQFINQSGRGGLAAVTMGTFSPFTVLTVLIDPYAFGGTAFTDNVDDIPTARILVFLFSLLSTGAYALIVWTMYKSMVKNFDMTIRRQSR